MKDKLKIIMAGSALGVVSEGGDDTPESDHDVNTQGRDAGCGWRMLRMFAYLIAAAGSQAAEADPTILARGILVLDAYFFTRVALQLTSLSSQSASSNRSSREVWRSPVNMGEVAAVLIGALSGAVWTLANESPSELPVSTVAENCAGMAGVGSLLWRILYNLYAHCEALNQQAKATNGALAPEAGDGIVVRVNDMTILSPPNPLYRPAGRLNLLPRAASEEYTDPEALLGSPTGHGHHRGEHTDDPRSPTARATRRRRLVEADETETVQGVFARDAMGSPRASAGTTRTRQGREPGASGQ